MNWMKVLAAAAMAACCGFAGPAALAAKPAAKPAAAAPAPTAPALSADDVGAWLDGLVPYAIEHHDIAGAVVVVVKDGQVLFQKGYGVADVKTRAPVKPETTLFRVGSVSKLFVWTAVMQLVEQGKLDLDKNINAYLDFKVDGKDGAPITLRLLMTHRGGFEEHVKNLIGRDPKLMKSLEDYERDNLPARIFAPGATPAYSNYGAGLAALIVQRVSGEPFEAYVEHHIFQPLGMAHASFRQPLPNALAGDMASGYEAASKPKKTFELVQPAPAGSLAASGADMARFMLAELNEGRLGEAQILTPASIRLMHTQADQPVPPLPGMGLGFFYGERNGHRIVGHGGDTVWFHTDLNLMPDDHIGVFMSVNSVGKPSALRSTLMKGFVDRYFPAPAPQEPTWPSAKTDGAKIAGYYESSRRSETTIISIQRLLEQIEAKVDKDGIVTVESLKDRAGNPKQWREVGPYVWREVGGKSRLAAVVKDGRVVALASDDFPAIMVLQPIPAGIRGPVAALSFCAAVLVLFIATFSWLIGPFIRLWHRRAFDLKGKAALAHRLVRLVCLADLVFLIGLLGVFTAFGVDATLASSLTDGWLTGLEVVGWLGLAGIAAVAWNVAVVFGDRARSLFAKGASLVILAACGVFAYFALSLHMLTFSLFY